MKILRTSYGYIFFIYLPIILIGLCLGFFFAPAMVMGSKILGWMFLLIAIIFALSPYGKQRIHSTTPHRTRHSLILLFSLQLGLGLIFLVLSQNIIVFLPILSEFSSNNNLPTSALSALHILGFNGGLFPWPIYLLLAIVLAHFKSDEKRVSALKNALRPMLKTTIDTPLGLAFDMGMYQSLFLSCAITLGLSILQISQLLSTFIINPMVSGLHFSTLLLSMLIFFVMATRYWQQGTHYLWQKQYSLKIFLVGLIIFLVLFITIFNVAATLLTPYLHNFTAPTPHFPFHDPEHWLAHWQLFTVIWWMGWTPLIAQYIAQLARGRTARELILTGLIVPICFALFAWNIDRHGVSPWILGLFHILHLRPIVFLLALVNMIMVGVFLKDSLLTNLFPAISANYRITLSAVRNLLSLITCMTLLYLLTGISLIATLAFSVIIPYFIIIALACWGYFKTLKS